MKAIKRILVALAVIILGCGVASAQFKYGVKAGMLVNNLNFKGGQYGDKYSFFDNSCGWTAGVMTEFTVPVIGLTFDAGLMYARMNNVVEDENVNKGDGDIYGKNFLEIPINLKYKFNIPAVASIIKPYFYTGPNIAFRLDKKVKTTEMESNVCQVAWNIGLGVELINHLQVSASYGFGINNVVKYIGVNAEDLKARNNYWTIGAAWLF